MLQVWGSPTDEQGREDPEGLGDAAVESDGGFLDVPDHVVRETQKVVRSDPRSNQEHADPEGHVGPMNGRR